MPRGKSENAAPTNEAPKRRRRRKARGGRATGYAPFLLLSGGPRKKPKAVSTFGALRAKVAALIKRGVSVDSIGIYQRRKAKVEQVVKI